MFFVSNKYRKQLLDAQLLSFSLMCYLDPIWDGGKGRPSYQFFPCNFSKAGTNYFLSFSFNLFAMLLWNFQAIPYTSLKLLNFNQDHLSTKILKSWSNFYKIGVLVPSLIKILELPNLHHRLWVKNKIEWKSTLWNWFS